MLFQNKELLSSFVAHQIIYVYEGIWKFGKVKPPMVIKN
jgi:hypothetical protein